MTEEQRRRLEAAGYRFTTVHEFLGLTSAEMALIDMKVALARALKALRRYRRLTQAQVAKRLGSQDPHDNDLPEKPHGMWWSGPDCGAG